MHCPREGGGSEEILRARVERVPVRTCHLVIGSAVCFQMPVRPHMNHFNCNVAPGVATARCAAKEQLRARIAPWRGTHMMRSSAAWGFLMS